MARKWHEHVKHLVVPHKGNNFKPKIIGMSAILAVLFLVLVFEGLYLFGTKVVYEKTNILASVLPSALIALTNADREDVGAGKLTENDLLAKAAQLKADDMAAKGYFSHVTPDGKQPWYWIEQAGYSYTYAGENLAVNFEDSKDVEKAWMDSPTHHANIVKPQYTEVGIATARGVYKGKEATFVVQFFGSPKVAVVEPKPSAPTETVTVVGEPSPVAEAVPVAVLGEETAAPVVSTSFNDSIAEVATSPSHMVSIALSVLAVIIGFMFLIALFSHFKMPYIEALGGTFAVLVLVIGLMSFNASTAPNLELPTDGAAATILAF